MQPLRNAVNDCVVSARVMAVPGKSVWLHGSGDEVLRAWVPDGGHDVLVSEAAVEVYLDVDGHVNGWWAPACGPAVNQRRLGCAPPPATGVAMVCRGVCGVVWQAPALAQLVEHHERCLTCAGPIAPG